MSDSLRPHGLYSPWNSPGQNTGVGSQPRDRTVVSCIAGRLFTNWAIRKANLRKVLSSALALQEPPVQWESLNHPSYYMTRLHQCKGLSFLTEDTHFSERESYGKKKKKTRKINFQVLFTRNYNFHFHALEKEMATDSSVLAWRIPGMGEPGGLPSMGSHRVGHDWSDLAVAAECILEKAMAPHSSTLAWKIPWMEEPGRLQSMGSLRVGHDWATSLFTHNLI